MISQPEPVASSNQIIGVLSPYYVVGQTTTGTWNRMRVDLWIWKGAHTAATSSNPTYVLTKNKINTDDDKVEINIAEYIADTINPTLSPFDGVANKSDNSFFYYEVRYFNNNILINTTQSSLLLGTLGWRYDYQNFTLAQNVGGGYFPDGSHNSEFGYFNLESKEQYYKYSEKMTLSNDRIWYTNMTFPITDSTTSVQYNGLVEHLQPSQIECSSYSYGIIFINKSGNWDMFPIFGKVTSSVDKTSTKYTRGFRYKTNLEDRNQKTVHEVNVTEKVTYTLNTGRISELLSNYLESIVYSPMIFIADYDKGLSYPVTLDSSTFNRKNMVNDKNNIQHTLSFVGDNNKRLNW